ncbi:MAG: hypothetical protein ACI4WV_08955 [Eubacteriales bacterium]
MKTASKVFLIIDLVWRGVYSITFIYDLITALAVGGGLSALINSDIFDSFLAIGGYIGLWGIILVLLILIPGLVFNIVALIKLSRAQCKTDVPIWLSVCVLIFGSLFGGIFMLCISDKDFMPKTKVSQTIYYQNVPPVQPMNGYSQGMPNGNPNVYQNQYPNGNPNAYQNPYPNGNPNAYQNPYPNGNPNPYQNANPTTYPNGNQNAPQNPTTNPNANPAPDATTTTNNNGNDSDSSNNSTQS